MKLYFATGNKKKVEELQGFLTENGVDIALEMLGKDVIEPATDDLEHIAAYKAELGLKEVNAPVIAEDTGLFIHSLNGFPGPFSKWIYSTIGIEGVLAVLKGKPREATFRTAIAFALPGKETITFVGEANGLIADHPRGSHGWGYDPIFTPIDSDKTWAEDYDAKKRDSHRIKALKKLVDYLKSNPFKA